MNTLATATILAATLATAAGAAEPLNALLITGQQNHDWVYTSDIHRKTLEQSGRFRVDVTTQAPRSLLDAQGLKKYQVFVLDYNGPRWGEAAEKNFVAAVSSGTGVVIIHASNNSFVGWSEYEKMCGLMWIQGTTGHGKFHNFDVTYTDKTHPVTHGLSDMKLHPDELYHKLVNVQKVDFKLLATAFSTTESGGSGQDEPMALTLTYGQGRIFHTPLGHVWANSPEQRASINDPQFKLLLARGAEWAASGAVTLPDTWTERPVLGASTGAKEPPAAQQSNTLSEKEKAEGWKLLFDGKSTDAWRGFKRGTFPEKGWEISDGTLHVIHGGGGGDIMTKDQYDDFEFACEWKVPPGGNSGIMYLVTEEDFTYPWQTGPEMQILDNKAHNDGKNTKTSAGALYDMIACSQDVSKPAGEWNTALIVKKGDHLEHWLNGVKVVETTMWNDGWKELIAQSKWSKVPSYGKNKKGHIAFQGDHDEVWFRNIKVRPLK